MERLTLASAIALNRLADFAAQAEDDGIGPADRAQFEADLWCLITEPLPEGQTSHLPVGDYSPET